MKLALVTAYPPSKVTLNEYAYHLIKNFRQQEKITELILFTDKTSELKNITFNEYGCKITIKECWKFNSYTNIISVTKAIHKIKPDAILFNLEFMKFGDKKIPATLGLMLPLICKLKGIPTIALLHNIVEKRAFKSSGNSVRRFLKYTHNYISTLQTKLILKADVVAVTIHRYVHILEKKYKVNNVKFIPHGTFEISEKPKIILPETSLKIMTFGKFGTYKKVENIIEAVVQLRQNTGLDLEIVIAGDDNSNTIGYLNEVAKKYKKVPQLTFTGYVEEKSIAKIFKESTVVVLPYTVTTGSAGVLHQAGSYAKAVVMPNIGDLRSLVVNEGYKGEFFEPNNINSLADAIEEIVTNKVYREHLEEVNYKAATAYPMQKITQIYINEFENIMEEKAIKQINVNPSTI